MSKRIIIVAALFAAAIAVWLVYDRLIRDTNEMPVFYGNVDIRDVTLGFRVSGRIEKMAANEGDSIKAGQLLASLDKTPFVNDLAVQIANVAQQRANFAKLKAGNREEDIAQARAAVDVKKAAVAKAKGVFGRQEKLAKRDYASGQAYDDAVAALRDAEAQLKSAQEALKLQLAGPRIEDIAAAKASLDAALAQKQSAETSLADADLHAPEDGVILTRAVEPGAIISSGTAIYTLSLQKPVWVRAYAPEPQLGLVHPGAHVKVFTDTKPDQPYDGQVGFVSPTAEFTPKSVETTELRTDLVYRFRVTVTNPDMALRQGMPVTVRLSSEAGAVASNR